MRRYALLLSILAAAPAAAQANAAPTTPSATADARGVYRTMHNFVARVAADLPEDKYGYRPTAGVRSFGELFAHVAGAEAMFCAMALGEKPPAEDAVKSSTKAGLVDALRSSGAACERAYAQTDAQASANIDVFGEQHSRLYALIMNASHDGEHYGNLVTYLRMNGMVPPSSQPQRRTP